MNQHVASCESVLRDLVALAVKVMEECKEGCSTKGREIVAELRSLKERAEVLLS